jgi:hypothetical protein
MSICLFNFLLALPVLRAVCRRRAQEKVAFASAGVKVIFANNPISHRE